MKTEEQAAFPADLMGASFDGAHGEASSDANKRGKKQKPMERAERDKILVIAAVRDQRITNDDGVKLLVSSGLSTDEASKLLSDD